MAPHILELISCYKILGEHLGNYRDGSVAYFPPCTQNRTINLTGNKHSNEIITEVQILKHKMFPHD
jgi:hypothetical protein